MTPVFHPPEEIGREEIVRASGKIMARPDIPFSETETILRIAAADMEWDIGVMLYEPDEEAAIPTGADGRKVGVFLTHGGASDWRSMEKLARLLAGKLGYRIASMTYPGRLYLPGPSRDWPGDTIRDDGTVRTPIWLDGERIADDEYEVVHDASMRARHGIRPNARARQGTRFHDRMASWPLAFEDAMKEICRRYFPPEAFSIYVHGHSTGGPFVNMLSQRVDNVVGLIGVENSPFGYIYQRMAGTEWKGTVHRSPDPQLAGNRALSRRRGAQERRAGGADEPGGADGGRARRMVGIDAVSAVQGGVHRALRVHAGARGRGGGHGVAPPPGRGRDPGTRRALCRHGAGVERSRRQARAAAPVRDHRLQPRPHRRQISRYRGSGLPGHVARAQGQRGAVRSRNPLLTGRPRKTSPWEPCRP